SDVCSSDLPLSLPPACRSSRGLPNPPRGFSLPRRKSAPRTSAREPWAQPSCARRIARKPQWRATPEQRSTPTEGISCFILLKKLDRKSTRLGVIRWLSHSRSISLNEPSSYTVIVNYNTIPDVKQFLSYIA